VLVLSRKVDQSVMVGDDIEITILAIRGDVISVGIRAPDDVPIFRHELKERLDRERLDRERLDREREGGGP
jgi:carbon storage regulator